MLVRRAHVYGCSSDPSIVPVARYSACEVVWHRWDFTVWYVVCVIVPIAVEVPVLLAGAYRHLC